jgi:hypothetical protein
MPPSVGRDLLYVGRFRDVDRWDETKNGSFEVRDGDLARVYVPPADGQVLGGARSPVAIHFRKILGETIIDGIGVLRFDPIIAGGISIMRRLTTSNKEDYVNCFYIK